MATLPSITGGSSVAPLSSITGDSVSSCIPDEALTSELLSESISSYM